jgi:hypothetical protein|uniref:Uncharacterized protein n=1 Tax=viral metagenome TaxID=1070528 RepID=A0A6C0IBJ6_9ZZZZ
MKKDSRNRSRKNMKKGGDSGAWMNAVAGDTTHQVGSNGTSGMLQYNTNPSLVVGGKRRKGKGGSVFADLAVPAVLLYTNQVMRRSKKSHSNKRVTRRR